jgi:hypothetical protein
MRGLTVRRRLADLSLLTKSTDDEVLRPAVSRLLAAEGATKALADGLMNLGSTTSLKENDSAIKWAG